MSAAPAPLRAAFQGAYGAFSHEACLHHLPKVLPTPFATFAKVFEAVRSGACERAFVPVENSIAGPVPEVAALLLRSGLRVVSEHSWPIRMQLMGAPGAALDQVRTVASHPMALKQCRAFLDTRGWAVEEAYDTAGAAAELAAGPEPTRAVIAPRAAAERYGLVLLAEDVQDRADNVTRFVVLAPSKPIAPYAGSA